MFDAARNVYDATLKEIREAGLFKTERVITTQQGAEIDAQPAEGKPAQHVLNFCANNYLGLSSHPRVIEAAKKAIDSHGFGLSSVRFICGTQDLHKSLEHTVSKFFGMEDTILYTSCFDANGGLFETLLGEEDAIISDALNHASIIDGIRLCKAERHRYPNGDMAQLEDALKKTQSKRIRMVATDGVFSMDGYLAKLDVICDLAEKYGAMVMVDDSHASGFMGPTGRGTPEHHGVAKRIDVMTSTLGKALGGAAGGFTTGKKEIIEVLRQRSRPYLFSNTVAPAVVGASIEVLKLLDSTSELRERLMANTKRFREGMTKAGFTIKEGIHPIVPVMLGDAKLAQNVASELLGEGIYVIGFFYPVVPKGEARIRVQLSAAHEPKHVDRAIEAFTKIGKKLGVLSLSEQFLKAWSGDLSKLGAAVGSKDQKLIKKLIAADMDVGELVGERGLALEDVLGEIVSGKLKKDHAYVYRRTLELFADVLLKAFDGEVTLPGRGWQDLAPAWRHWGAKTLAKFWAGDHGWPWKKNTTTWPYVYVIPKKSQKAIANELKAIKAKTVIAKGVPRGIDRFSEDWPMEHLAPEVENAADVIRGWCKGKNDVLVWHDGQQ